jgi:hypothetical protein
VELIPCPDGKRRVIEGAREELEVSERRACRAVEQPRSTKRNAPRRPGAEKALVGRMLELMRLIAGTGIGGSGRFWGARAGK